MSEHGEAYFFTRSNVVVIRVANASYGIHDGIKSSDFVEEDFMVSEVLVERYASSNKLVGQAKDRQPEKNKLVGRS